MTVIWRTAVIALALLLHLLLSVPAHADAVVRIACVAPTPVAGDSCRDVRRGVSGAFDAGIFLFQHAPASGVHHR